MTKDDLRALMWRASSSQRGILLKTSDPRKLRELFYPLRAEEPSMRGLVFRIVETAEGNVQIEKREEP